MADFIREASVESVRVRTPDQDRLTQHLRNAGATVTPDGTDALTVQGATSQEIGTIAGQAGITLWELSPRAGSLEDAYLALTRETLDFQEAA